MMNFNIIVAYCNKNGIGNNNSIPWQISDDMKSLKLLLQLIKKMIKI